MTYELVNLHIQKIGKETWQIHKEGCKDANDKKGRVDSIQAETANHLIKRELELNNNELLEMGYTAENFKIMPCVYHLS